MEDKKGLATQIILLIVMGIILMAIVLGLYIFHLIGAPVQSIVGGVGGVGEVLTESIQGTENQELIDASASSFEPALKTFNNLEWIAYVFFILAFLIFIFMCFYIRVYPFLIWIWIVFIVILVILSLYLTNAYQGLVQDPTLNGYYSSWENTDFMLKNLPAIISVLGTIGAIIMFILASKEQEIEGGTRL